MGNLAGMTAILLLLLGSSAALAQPNENLANRGDAVQQGRDYNQPQNWHVDDHQRGETRNDNQRGEPPRNDSENQGANHYQKPSTRQTVSQNEKVVARHKVYWRDMHGHSHWRWSTPS
jgi:hypothetical protein